MRLNDAVFGVILLLAAVAVFAVARGFPGMPGQNFGPALFPDLIAAGFFLCGAALVWSGLRHPEFAGLVAFGDWAKSGGHLIDVALVIGGLGLVILLWDRVGFLIVATLFTGSLMARFRGGGRSPPSSGPWWPAWSSTGCFAVSCWCRCRWAR